MRLAGIERDLPRGAPPKKVELAQLVELTTQTQPEAAPHRSTRKMAAKLGVHSTTIARNWQAAGLKPHLVRGFKVSRDPKFVDKLEDIVGLYMAPPEHALVLCCDEKSQVQALDRTQPGLPLKKGRAATMSHDYKRNGTTTLFAALNVLDGQVIGQCQQRHHRATAPRRLHQRPRTHRRHRRIHRSPQYRPQAFHLDQERTRHPAEGHPRQQPLKFQTGCSTTLDSHVVIGG
jgi:hypothetical protein